MTNREKLIQTNIYDLLCRIDKGIKSQATCVIETLDKDNACKRCDLGKQCPECIAKWLNEEAE